MSESFYDSVDPVDRFEALAESGSYVALPDGWSIVAADVTGSTQAIGAGRYKEVNTVGVSVIAAVRNVVAPLEVPYVFGGDGALLCVPDRFDGEVRAALAATVAMAASSFGLTLRAAVVPVPYVRDRGLDVLVARHRVSEHYVQCALFGGGATAVERMLKDGDLPADFVVDADVEAEADYTGLECRWNEIPSPAAETVALIVETPVEDANPLATYGRVMARTREIYGDAEQCRPVAQAGLSMTMSRSVLSNEIRLKHWRDGVIGRVRAALSLRLAIVVGWFLIRFGVRTEATDWSDYKPDLVANTDFRKFDGSLRLVLAGSEAQRAKLVAFLERARSEGALSYGIHVSGSALMTCLIEKRQGSHFHFVDAAGGGYAAAAMNLKEGRAGS